MEKQGANLIIECILRSIKVFMKEKKLKTLRNVNVFLDNCSSNKCQIMIAALASLVLLGMFYILCLHVLNTVNCMIL